MSCDQSTRMLKRQSATKYRGIVHVRRYRLNLQQCASIRYDITLYISPGMEMHSGRISGIVLLHSGWTFQKYPWIPGLHPVLVFCSRAMSQMPHTIAFQSSRSVLWFRKTRTLRSSHLQTQQSTLCKQSFDVFKVLPCLKWKISSIICEFTHGCTCGYGLFKLSVILRLNFVYDSN